MLLSPTNKFIYLALLLLSGTLEPAGPSSLVAAPDRCPRPFSDKFGDSVCTECFKTFENRAAALGHIRFQHPVTQEFVCDKCHVKYRNEAKLSKHKCKAEGTYVLCNVYIFIKPLFFIRSCITIKSKGQKSQPMGMPIQMWSCIYRERLQQSVMDARGSSMSSIHKYKGNIKF